MDGLPVVIRLLDPPLHEFLPNLEEQLVKVTRAECAGGASDEDKRLLAAIEALHEQNPMSGLRGCRLGLMVPQFVRDADARDPECANRRAPRGRTADREDHDPARGTCERARSHARAARGGGAGSRAPRAARRRLHSSAR